MSVPVFRSSRTKSSWAVGVSDGDSLSFPLAWEGIFFPLATIIVGLSSVLVRSVHYKRSKLVTKEPVAPESRIAYMLEDWGGTKALLVIV